MVSSGGSISVTAYALIDTGTVPGLALTHASWGHHAYVQCDCARLHLYGYVCVQSSSAQSFSSRHGTYSAPESRPETELLTDKPVATADRYVRTSSTPTAHAPSSDHLHGCMHACDARVV